jgi:hypothetical protein
MNSGSREFLVQEIFPAMTPKLGGHCDRVDCLNLFLNYHALIIQGDFIVIVPHVCTVFFE